jgi:hypothetical protein
MAYLQRSQIFLTDYVYNDTIDLIHGLNFVTDLTQGGNDESLSRIKKRGITGVAAGIAGRL